ncbi:GAS2 domain-containing protein [Rutstroemia sp. NJR-2017a BVV2]|nr:GAS2 domain-containing protein [Rutstroemia sp. NJR-2017a BVV2]
MERPAIFSPSAPRLAPLLHPQSAARPPSRSISRSHVLDDLLSDLTPATTLEAFTSPSGKLKASIEAASPADRAFGIRATLASKKVEQWLEELSSWPWPAGNGSMGFEVPHAKRKKTSSDKPDVYNEEEDQEAVEAQYCGSLLAEEVARYEQRIDEIGRDMEELEVEEIKREVLDSHFSSRSRPSSSASSIAVPAFLSSYTVLDDFTAIVTATVLQALPNLSKLTRLMDIWSVRLSVLRRVPALLLGMDDAEMALKSGWKAIEISIATKNESGENDSSLTRQTFEIMKNVLQAKVTILGRDLDYMLDTLEGRMDTLPDSWLDRMESIERDYGEWVVAADRKITEGDLATIRTKEKAGVHSQRSTEAMTPVPLIQIQPDQESEQAMAENTPIASISQQIERTTPDSTDIQNPQHEIAADFTTPNLAAEIVPSESPRIAVEPPNAAAAYLPAPGDIEDHGAMDSTAIQSSKADVRSTSPAASMLTSLAVGATSAAAAGVAYQAVQGSREGSVDPVAAVEDNLLVQKASESPEVHDALIHPIDDTTISQSIEEPSTPVRRKSTSVAHGNLSTPQTTPSTSSTQVREREVNATPISKSPSPPPTPSTSVDARPSHAAIIPSPVDLRSIGRSSSVRSIAKTPKFGHAVANALRRSISVEDISPRTMIEASSGTSPVLDWSTVILPTRTSAVHQSDDASAHRTQMKTFNEQPTVTVNGSALPVLAGATASSIALVEQLGLSSSSSSTATDVDSQIRRSDLRLQHAPLTMLSPIKEHHLSKETEPPSPTRARHTTGKGQVFPPVATNDELLHTSSITGSDGAYESMQRFDPDELDLDVLDHRRPLDARRPSIMVDDTDDEGRRDSIDSSASIVDRRPLVISSGLPLRSGDQDSDSGSAATYEDSPLHSRNSQQNSRNYDKTPPGSPPGVPASFARRPPQLLESPDFSHISSTNEDAPFLDDVEVTHSIPASPIISSSDDQMQQQISSLLQSIPAHIRLRSEPEEKPNQDKLRPRKVRRSVTPSIRPQTSTSSLRAPTPSFTLAPAYAKSGTPRHRAQNGSPEIKVYHLSRSSGEAPIKLFVRLVGENGQRVMVRVGGGWADLGEYLKEYALHHGRRAQADTDKVEIQDLPPRAPSASVPTSGRVTPAPRSASAMGYSRSGTARPGTAMERPKSSLGVRKVRRKSTMTASDERPAIPSMPLPLAAPNTPFSSNANSAQTPPSAASRSSSRMSWTEEENGELGLAGPRGRNKELEERDREWVECMKEKVMMASAEKEKERKGPGGHRKSLGEMDKVGGTKRLFRKSSRLDL